MRETEGGTRLDKTLAVSPTWAENHRFTDAIRSRLKEAGVLTEGQQIVAHHSLQWTRQQMGDAHNYRPGFVVTFNRKTAGMSRGQSMVVERVEGDRVYFQGSNKAVRAPLARGQDRRGRTKKYRSCCRRPASHSTQ